LINELAGSYRGRTSPDGWRSMAIPVRSILWSHAPHGDHTVFGTAAGSKQEAAKRGQAATFQVDAVRFDGRLVWRVMVLGPLETVEDEKEYEAASVSTVFGCTSRT